MERHKHTIIIAPNAFKHSLSALEIAKAIKEGLENSPIHADYIISPIADGGEGLTDIIVTQKQGKFYQLNVRDALGRTIQTSYGVIDNDTAVIELARASGLKWLKENELNPMLTSTYGTGEMIRDALDKGYRKFIIGLGNSATVDGGSGLLAALGAKFLDENNKSLPPGGDALSRLAHIDISNLDQRIKASKITIACDVTNPLLGHEGSSRVFGPQKGASKEQVEKLEIALQKFAEITKNVTGKNISETLGGGAAGGVAAGLFGFFDAEIVSGVEYLMQITEMDDLIKSADLVITAEGGLDEQTLGGKGPYGVAKLAKKYNKPVVLLAGQFKEELPLNIFKHIDVILPIGSRPTNLEAAIAATRINLIRTAEQVGQLINMNLIQSNG